MGIDVYLEDEDGNLAGEVTDDQMRLSRAVRSGGLDSTICLRFVDPYGDAVFNHLQAPLLVAELRDLRTRVDEATAALLDSVVPLVEEVGQGVHLYVRFRGD